MFDTTFTTNSSPSPILRVIGLYATIFISAVSLSLIVIGATIPVGILKDELLSSLNPFACFSYTFKSDSFIENCSFCSTTLSSIILTENVALLSPISIVAVPVLAVKSFPDCAVPLIAS